MGAGGADLRRIGPLVDVPALEALPSDRILPPEEGPRLEPLQEPQVPLFVVRLHSRDHAELGGRLGKPLLLGDLPEGRVDGAD